MPSGLILKDTATLEVVTHILESLSWAIFVIPFLLIAESEDTDLNLPDLVSNQDNPFHNVPTHTIPAESMNTVEILPTSELSPTIQRLTSLAEGTIL